MQLMTTDTMVNRAELKNGAYYRECVQSLGIVETIGANLVVTPDVMAVSSAYRPEDAGPFHRDEQRRTQALLPHLRRVMQMQLLLAEVRTEKAAARTVLNRLQLAVFLVDGAGRVAFMNRLASELFQENDGLVIRAGRLAAATSDTSSLLNGLVAYAGASITVREVSSGRRVARLWGTKRYTYELEFSPDGAMLASHASIRGTEVTTVWDLKSRQVRWSYSGHPPRGKDDQTPPMIALTFSPDGRFLAAVGRDHAIRLWNLASGSKPRLLRGHRTVVSLVAFSPNSRVLASAGSGTWRRRLRFWDVESGKCIEIMKLRVIPTSLTFSKDGKSIFSGNANGTVTQFAVGKATARLQNRRTREVTRRLSGQQTYNQKVPPNPTQPAGQPAREPAPEPAAATSPPPPLPLKTHLPWAL